jgi:hypothetical protein
MRLRKLATLTLLISAPLLLAGCGVFGCGAAATNGAALGGCHAGTSF